MLTGVHFLLTYMCNRECDHCFVYSGPQAKGTFTLSQIKKVFNELHKIGTIEWVYFEGGEPFLFYPMMVEGLRMAGDMGFKTGVVTNAYWATSEEDAELWLKPLFELGVSDLSISDDSFHSDNEKDSHAGHALSAAKRLGIPTDVICIEKPTVIASGDSEQALTCPPKTVPPGVRLLWDNHTLLGGLFYEELTVQSRAGSLCHEAG